jgi:alpha-1,2-glucosyltransferase
LLPFITNIPGYHVVILLLSKLIYANHAKIPTLQEIRLISLMLSSISIWIFYLISKKLNHHYPLTRTLQFVFLPITFLYFPLLYTDIFSLLMVLTAFYFTIKKQYKFSALFSFASLLVRQDNIIWVLFIWLYEYISIYGFSVSYKKIIDYIKSTFEYIFIFFAFIAFVFFNKGIAMGDKTSHEAGFYMGNIYFFLAFTAILFLPYLIASVRKFDVSKMKSLLIFGIIPGALIALSFIVFPPAIHPYNLNNLKVTFLRNIILRDAYGQYIWLYVSAIFIGFMTLFLMKFEKKNYLIFPFTFLALVPSLLVEQRYAIVSLVFLLLLHKEYDSGTERSLVPYFLAISLGLTYMIFTMNIFF